MFDAISHLKTVQHPKIVILTGAGISAESGIKTFRDGNGLWENHNVADVATPEAFARNPELVYRFYNARRQQLISGDVHANLAHIALAKLENALQDRLIIVTQNVDDLHERAGCRRVLHMHGDLLTEKCVFTGKSRSITSNLDANTLCDCCRPGKPMRPDIVWFGEMPYQMGAIEQYLIEADLFISIGTSGNVYPAAGFVQIANYAGAYSLELNLEPTAGKNDFSECHYGLASKLVPAFVDDFCSRILRLL